MNKRTHTADERPMVAMNLSDRLNSGMAWTITDQKAAAERLANLSIHINAMCGWAETLAEKQGWTRDTAGAFWAARDAARKAAHE